MLPQRVTQSQTAIVLTCLQLLRLLRPYPASFFRFRNTVIPSEMKGAGATATLSKNPVASLTVFELRQIFRLRFSRGLFALRSE